MKLRLPYALFRSLMACLAAIVTTSLASASSDSVSGCSVTLPAPDVEQTDSMLCWAASAADMLALQTGQDAAAIYRCITAASGNAPGYVESALSWYMEGAQGELQPQHYDGRHSITRRGFESLDALAATFAEALQSARAASAMLYAHGDSRGTGHALTVYACRYENGRLYLHYADSADGVQGLRRAEVLCTERGLVLAGTDYAIDSVSFLGMDEENATTAAPVGAYMHSSPLLQEYTDMAENRGIYRFGQQASLLTYRNGEADYTVEVTPDYAPVADMGCFTLVNNGSYQLTVEHNGIMSNATFSGRYVGDYAQQYSGVGIRYNTTFVFGWNNPYVSMNEDYKVERLSRLVTDTSSMVYNTNESLLQNLGSSGLTIYRVGAGNSGVFDTQGNINYLVDAWGAGMTAGITTLVNSYGTEVYMIEYRPVDFEQTSSVDPLPSSGMQGDSGSPVMIYNAAEQRFEFVGPLQGADPSIWISRYNPSATTEAIDYCTVTLATSAEYDATRAEATTYYISGAKVREGDTLIEDDGAAAYLRQGTISLNGEEVARFNGVALGEFSQGTWKLLDADSLTWYTYKDADYINALPDVKTDANTFGTDDLFYTSNLHFTADAANGSSTAQRRIELTEDVDLGVGHVQFSLGEGATSATYELGQSSSDFFLSSAGFVVDKGVTLNNYFTYEKGRELRRVGEGTMNMVGEGNNDVLLNIGGGGITYLDRTGGYAAYSALVNNKAVLRLADVGQVHNNVTLGAHGGVLDFNGNDFRWTSGGARAAGSDGETYFGLTVYEGLNRVETSAIANYAAGTTSTITIERADSFEFAGAFRDGSTYTGGSSIEMDSRYTMMPAQLMGLYKQYTAADRVGSNSTLKVIYDGGATLSMTGVYTLLTGDSGLEVASGTVSLHGTNTIHAIGSESGVTLNRWDNKQDWHYAMAEMGVRVNSGANFELGDHALLIGNVQVDAGGSFVMKQAVNERHEYVEGWYKTEDTYALADYYGLKGNVALAAGAAMTVQFDEGVATQLTYGGNISGEGSLTVAAGKGSVTLSGQNDFSGEKTVQSGKLRVAEGAEGNTDTHKWLVQEQGSLAMDAIASNADVERLVDAQSTGVLALTQDFEEQLTSTHSGLIVGAAAGKTVHYGSEGASLAASGNEWTLGGGGGTLMVDFLLEGGNTLVLGNEYGSGLVVLTNAANSFSGGVELPGGVTLGYTHAAALGNNVLTIGYGQSLASVNGAAFAADKVAAASDGVFALSDGAGDIDFSQHGSLSLGANGEATLSGSYTVAEGAAYRLGGSGSLTVATELSGNHGIVIDGQGSTGSRVIFATASTDSGEVVVQGYDTSKASATMANEADVTLSFTTDNALASAASVTLQNNAGMDLNGTNQRFNKLVGDEGSLVFDDKGGNTLTLDVADTQSLALRVQAAGTDVVKSGSGTLELTGEKLWKSLTINEGSVKVADGKALGYLSSGSQDIAVSVNAGALLHVTAETSFTNTLNVAGFGADGAGVALRADGHLNNNKATLNVTADAAISGQFSFKQLNLQGNELTVHGNGTRFTASSIVGEGGRLIIDNGSVSGLTGASYDLELNNATFYVSKGSFAGELSVGAQGATIEYPWNDSSQEAFNLNGFVSGSSADSTLKLVAYKHSINLAGGAQLAGKLEVGNGVTLNITKDSSIGALVREANSGDAASVVVNAATLELSGAGSNFSNASISLTNGGSLQLTGLADGSSMGSLSSLKMGSDGVLTVASLAGYTSNAMMSIASIEGTRSLAVDLATLPSLADGATYHLLTSANELSGWTLLNQTQNSRLGLELISGGSAGAYTLDLKVTGQVASAEWKGTGTLVAGTAMADNIISSAGDATFMANDSLTITSADASSNDTLTLGAEIAATSVTYTGAGTVTLAQQDGGKFAKGVDVVVDGPGMLALGDTTAISGKVELKQGTLSASSTSLNGTEGVQVTGDANFELTSATHVTAGIDVAEDASLAISFKTDSMADQWGGNLDDNLSGAGQLKVAIGSGNELHLNGNHGAFTGSIDVQSGTLQLGMRQDNGVLYTATLGARNISVANGAALSLCSAATTLAADIAWADGATLQVKDGESGKMAYTLSGKQSLAGELKVSHTKGIAAQVSGDIEGTGSLNFVSGGEGNASFILSGNNSYSGGTTIDRSGLTVYAANANALGTGAIKLQNGALGWVGVGTDWNGDLAARSIELNGAVSLDSNGQDVTYSGEVFNGMNGGLLTKTGAGMLNLTNFKHTGGVHVQEGTLGVSISDTSWYKAFSGEEGTTLKITTTSPYGSYLMGAMSGGMTVELSGDFAYAAANTHTGGTKLVSGSLDIGSQKALQSGALLASEGTTVTVRVAEAIMAGNSAVDYLAFDSGASVAVGTDTAAGSLSFNSLGGTASFLLDIFSADSYDSLAGTLTPGSLLGVNIKANELGSYLLVAGDNTGFDTSTITLTGNTGDYSYIWSATEAGLTLNIANNTSNFNTWTGGSGTWDRSSTSSWNYGEGYNSSATNALFSVTEDTTVTLGTFVGSNELVITADTAAGSTLTLDSAAYSFDAKQIVKEGEGTFIIKAGDAAYANVNYGGGVLVKAGVLSVDDISALGTTSISGDGTFELTGGSATARLHDTLTVKNLRITNGAELTYTSTADSSEWGGNARNRYIEILGEGSTLSLTKWSSINASTILLGDGGTLCTGENGLGNDGGTIYVDGSGVIKSGNEGTGDIAAAISGKGELTIARWNGTSQANLNGVIADAEGSKLSLVLDHNNVHLKAANTYSGGTTITSGSVTTTTETALGTGAVTMNGGTLNLGAKLAIGSLSGTGGTIATGGQELQVNQTADGAYSGTISGSGTLTKAGSATLELSGNNSMAAINLQAGRLVAASDGALEEAAIAVTAGASLYVANDATVTNALSGGSYIVGAEAEQSGTFSGAAGNSLVASGFTKEGEGRVTVVNGSGTNPAGAMTVHAGTLAYDAGSSSVLGAVSGNGTFALVGGAVNASSINVGKLVVENSLLAYSATFDGKVLEVSGQGAELRMGHWASVNNSTLLLKDGGQLSMSSSGFNNSTVTVSGSGIIAVGETASPDDNPLLNIESSISGQGTLHITDYGSRAYTVNINKAIADGAEGALALESSQSDLHLKTANSYSGGTTLNGGQLTAEAAGALGSGDVTINGGKLAISLGSSAQLFYIGSLSGTGGSVDMGAQTLVIEQAKDGRYDGSFSNGTVLKRGESTLELGGAMESVSVQIANGTIKLVDSDVFGANGATSSLVTLYGGVFDINGQTTGAGADSFMFNVDSGYLSFRGSSDMLVTDSSGREGAGLGFNTDSKYAYAAVAQWGSGQAEIAADIVSGGNGAAGGKIGFNFGNTGSGDVLISGNIGAEGQHFGIARNGTGTGKLILSGNNAYTGGTDINAGTLVAASDTALGMGAVSVASGATLEVAAGKNLALGGDATFASGATLKLNSGAKLNLNSGASLHHGDVYSLRQKAEGKAVSLGAATLTSDSAAGTGSIRGTGAELSALDNVVIDIAQGKKLELKEVILKAPSSILGELSTLSMDNVTVELGETNTTVGDSSLLPEGLEFVRLDANDAVTLYKPAEVLSIFCSALDSVNVTGSSLTLDLSGCASSLAEGWGAYEYVAVSFGLSESTLANFDTTSLDIRATLDGSTYSSVYVRFDERESASTFYIPNGYYTASIPEPTTATLSLLALSLLAARRRRRD